MTGGSIIRSVAALLALLCAVLASPATASSLVPACHAFAEPGRTPTEWSCGAVEWTPTERVAWLRFDLGDGPRPTQLIAPISRFERVTIRAIDLSGVERSRSFGFAEAVALPGGPRMALPLPGLGRDTRTVIVEITGAWSVLTNAGTRLAVAHDPADPWGYRTMLLVAMLAGLLCAPLIFDLAFYSALRERFLLWHGAMALGMLTQTVMATGLGVALFGLTPNALAVLSPLAFALAVAAAAFFSASFIEEGMLSGRMRRLLRASGWWVAIVPGVLALQLPVLRETGGQVFNLAFQPTVVIFLLTMLQAARRGSRAARFQLAAWVPILACGTDRMMRGVGLYALPSLADQAIYFAMALEVVITTLGVADRFIILRRERDLATARASELERVVERDALTGLLNRRGLDARFGELAAAGYTAMAVLDLDHFKSVNDTHGHAVGDDVLRAVAKALAPDDDTRAVRLGGEEFLLLLRGGDIAGRAERRRMAISARVAAEVPGLDRMVTASMGLVERVTGIAAHHDFAALYAHCDRLLYEAKATGRNRTMRERVQSFGGDRRRGGDRRKHVRQAA